MCVKKRNYNVINKMDDSYENRPKYVQPEEWRDWWKWTGYEHDLRETNIPPEYKALSYLGDKTFDIIHEYTSYLFNDQDIKKWLTMYNIDIDEIWEDLDEETKHQIRKIFDDIFDKMLLEARTFYQQHGASIGRKFSYKQEWKEELKHGMFLIREIINCNLDNTGYFLKTSSDAARPLKYILNIINEEYS